MMDGGIVLVLVAAALLILEPAQKLLEHRRSERTDAMGEAVRLAYPLPSPEPTLDALAAAADAALADDPLIRATASLARTYDQA